MKWGEVGAVVVLVVLVVCALLVFRADLRGCAHRTDCAGMVAE